MVNYVSYWMAGWWLSALTLREQKSATTQQKTQALFKNTLYLRKKPLIILQIESVQPTYFWQWNLQNSTWIQSAYYGNSFHNLSLLQH